MGLGLGYDLRVRAGGRVRVRVRVRVGAQILRLVAAFGGLASGFKGAGAAAQKEGPGPRLWQGWP